MTDVHRQPRPPRRSGVRRRSRRGRSSARATAGARRRSSASANRSPRRDARRAIAAAHPGFVFATAGVHPHDAARLRSPRATSPAISELVDARRRRDRRVRPRLPLRPLAARPPARAPSPRSSRSRSELDRPVVVHTREAEDDTRAMVVEAGARRRARRAALLHRIARARRGRARRRLVRLVQRDRHVQEVGRTTRCIRLVPDDRLLVESDSPYLAPVPHRGKRNEPAWVSFTVARVAARVAAIDAATRSARSRRRGATTDSRLFVALPRSPSGASSQHLT